MAAEPPDARAVAWQVHDLASRLMDEGCCPACLASALADEAFFLAKFVGELEAVQEVASRYKDEPLRKH